MSKLSFKFDKDLKVYGWCEKHGNSEFSLPDGNMNSHCLKCGMDGFSQHFGSDIDNFIYKASHVLRVCCENCKDKK